MAQNDIEALSMKEILKNLVETTTLPEDAYLEQDSEFVEIFVEEIEEIYEELETLIPTWLAEPNHQETLVSIRRYFHTLKGSGRMVGAKSSGELAWTVEDTLNRVISQSLILTPQIQQYVTTVFRFFQYKLTPHFKEVVEHDVDLRPLVLLGQQLQKAETVNPALLKLLDLAHTLTSSEVITGLELTDVVHEDASVEEDAVQHVIETEQDSAIDLSLDTATEQPAFEWVEMIDEVASNAEIAPIEPVETANQELDVEAVQGQLDVVDIEKVSIEDLPKSVETQHDISEDQHIPADLGVVALTETEQAEFEAAQAEILVAETKTLFLEEAQEHLNTIDGFLLNETPNSEDYNDLIRALHTLRGSSAMAHIDHIFEASSKVEHLFKVFLDEEIHSSSNELAILTHYSEFVRDYLHTLNESDAEARLEEIAQTFNDTWASYDFQVANDDEQHVQGLVSQLLDLGIDTLLDTEFDFEQRIKDEFPVYLQSLQQQAELLIEHTVENRATVGIHQFTVGLKQNYDELLEKPALLHLDYAYELFGAAHQELIHLFDTLAAGQRGKLTESSEKILSDLQAFVQQDIVILDDVESIESTESTESLQQETPVVDVNDVVIDTSNTATSSPGSLDLAAISAQIDQDKATLATLEPQDHDADLLDIFLEEADELLVSIDEDLTTWVATPHDNAALNNLMRHLHTLKGGANMIQAVNIGLIAHELETIYERLIHKQMQPSESLIHVIQLVQDNIADRIQTIRDDRIDYPADHAVHLLKNIGQIVAGQASTEKTVVSQPEDAVVPQDVGVEPSHEDVSSDTELVTEALDSITQVDAVSDANTSDQSLETAHLSSTELPTSVSDQESIRSISEEAFLEEAEELLDTLNHLLTQWFDDRNSRSLTLQIQRAAHSLKGGARMVEMENIGDIAYLLEMAFEQVGSQNFNHNTYDDLFESVVVWLKKAIYEHQEDGYDSLKAQLENLEFKSTGAQLPDALLNKALKFDAALDFVQGDGTEPPSMMGEWDNFVEKDNNEEMIRISADLIEKMIDLSGENSINRSRIEMDLGQLGNTLNEMELAIQRLADQLRRMEGELESQIIAKHGSENSLYADFDPLEMDQYSSLNQLSKSLAESASDLVDFKVTLAEKIRDTESLLLQQSRIQAEIQESLMRTRLVPFSRMLPRLQRIVRQTSSSLNRPAELVVQNTEGELDRTILEKLVSPFEHMLRNAIDHGIEDTPDRLQAGKSEMGRIELNITRQGTDVVISFTDDGKGIDAEKIKAKAIQLGLLTKEKAVTHNEALQFIFHPGFSTAQQVTQISGRGVGLDVVQSGIKALGGQIDIDSELGKGTTFTIRVPTTVSVSDALMVKIADQQYALALSQIERIVRISPAALEQYFNGHDEFFSIDNVSYKLRYLSEFIANQPMPRLNAVGHSLPVLLVKGNMGQTIALLVDQLIGSRAQIVVKPIGQQFASIGAVAGATILGDGQVCLILDGQNIARQIQSTQRTKLVAEQRDSQRHEDQRRLIMIVDDSVTVRKVTTRLLERNGYDVVTAKDGIDAIEQLENVKPSLMLLDIEMPRMDGFEVTNLVRHHEVHQELPIIMITSRTGEKHRERAFSLGVNQYMGKPFQEAELLANIESILEHNT